MNPIPVFSSLLLPTKFLGCDRELTMLLTLVCAAAGVLSVSLYGALISLTVFSAGYVGLRRMAALDPLLRTVFFAQLRYRRFYPAQAS